MEEVLSVELREIRGKRRTRRLRKSGRTPAVLYGHGGESLSLSIPSDVFRIVVRRGTKLLQLAGGVSDTAVVHDLQWDAFGSEVLHVDFKRVSAGERIRVTVAVQLRGDAPGVREGGIVEQLIREVEIDVMVSAIPERLHVNINGLGLGQSMTTAQFEDLPAGAKLLGPPEAVVVQCVVPAEEKEEVGEGEKIEPELIGGKSEDEAE